VSYDETLAKRIRVVLGERTDIVEKKMFGGLCFMVGGTMCCGLTKTDFMVRVGPAQHDDALAQPHARPMDFTGRPLAGMVYVAPEGVRSRGALVKWVERGVRFVSSLPAKAARRPKIGSDAKRTTKPARGKRASGATPAAHGGASGEGREPAIDAYLVRLNPTNRALLEELRTTIRAAVPQAEECISYRLPAFRLEGRIIAGFSATSKGCSYYPFSGTTLKTLAEVVEGYDQTKGALHFGPDNPLPKSLVRQLLRARIAEDNPRQRVT
jgi:uncharacterized protein YdhG (YjbR/CyaY superfamily)/TfoX/Sxy family transcriptional regulator of competence genes